MEKLEVFQVLGIEETKDERAIKDAYRKRLTVTNPEDNPEEFKRLRAAYEEACRLARQTSEENTEQERDETPSGLWVAEAAAIYGSLCRRRDVDEWKRLFDQDCFLSLEDEENCRIKLLHFLMEHFRLPGEVWKLLDKKLSLTGGAAWLREKFPGDFVRYVLNKCERGEDVNFDQFEGEDDAPYDTYLQYYDRCWQSLQQGNLEQAEQCLEAAGRLGIRHPVMEVCRADLLERQGKTEEAIRLLEQQLEKYPGDLMLCYNTAETLWRQGAGGDGGFRRRAADIYKSLKQENDSHYMANVRLTEWYYDSGQFQEAKKCAEKVLSLGGSDEFMELLGKVNREIEKELEEKWRENRDWKAALELCWCYLQDGRVTRGISLALKLEKLLSPEKEAEWNGLMAKLYVEAAEYESSIAMTRFWEESLEKKLLTDETEEEREKDRDRMKQTHMIRMQCNHNLGFRDRERFAEAIREGEAVLEGSLKDVGILLEMAQIYTEMKEYEKCEETVRRLVEDYQIYAAYATSMEAYRRQLNAGGVVRTASQCIRYFPGFAKAYEYVAKVYLDLERYEDLDRVLEDAEKNGVKSVILEAYRFQKNHKPMDIELLNNSLKQFRKEFRKPVEEGRLPFFEPGIEKLTGYLYHCPDSYMFVERGIFYRAAHHYKEAKEDFEKALTLNPANPYALNGLSFVYKYMGNYDKALFYIKKAILYMDKDMSPVIYTDMADLYSLLGCYDMALAACRQYQQITGDENAWFLNQLAGVFLNMGQVKEACELYKKSAGKDKRSYYEKCLDACAKCGEAALTEEFLQEWADELGIKERGRRSLFPVRKETASDSRGCASFYRKVVWVRLIFGEKEGVAEAMKRLRKYDDTGEEFEGNLADMTFACIVCGLEKEGRKYSARLAGWLRKEKFAAADKYFNQEKGYLELEILAAWYTEGEEKLQELLDREQDCGICHFCTSAVCREMEGVRILFLIRQGKAEEARERLHRNLEIQPADEYMLAIKHMVFGEEI